MSASAAMPEPARSLAPTQSTQSIRPVPSVPRVPPALGSAEWRQRPLLIQCWMGEARELARYTDRPGGGMVITAENGKPYGAYERARELREEGYRRPLLLDAARYAVKNGAAGDCDPADFDLAWLDRQRELGLPVLTDSGYVAEDDRTGLTRVLDRAAQVGDAIALLPLHPSWLVREAARRALLLRIHRFGVPVAILLEHTADPFDVPGAIDGLLAVLACAVPVLLLRSDVSALGALACGAFAAAAGTSAALRHLHPGRWTQSHPSVFVRSCLSYKRLDQVKEAKRRYPDAEGLWRCACPTCNDSDLDWILTQEETSQAGLAATHSVNVLLDLRERRVVGPDPGIDRVSWRDQCWHANWRRREAGWDPAPALDCWHRALAGPVGPTR